MSRLTLAAVPTSSPTLRFADADAIEAYAPGRDQSEALEEHLPTGGAGARETRKASLERGVNWSIRSAGVVTPMLPAQNWRESRTVRKSYLRHARRHGTYTVKAKSLEDLLQSHDHLRDTLRTAIAEIERLNADVKTVSLLRLELAEGRAVANEIKEARLRTNAAPTNADAGR